MKTPFTAEQFFSVFEKYNLALFPVQWVMLILAVFMLFVLHSMYSLKSRLIGSFLCLLWLWVGLVYHIIFFTVVNKLAFVFGVAFIIQGVLILINTFFTTRLTFKFSPQTKNYLGYFFIIFGLIIYPIISYFINGSLNRIISLGLPCPSTIFTFGCFMMTGNKFPKYLLIIPSIWAILGVVAAIQFGVYQDFMMPVAAIIANAMLIKKS